MENANNNNGYDYYHSHNLFWLIEVEKSLLKYQNLIFVALAFKS